MDETYQDAEKQKENVTTIVQILSRQLDIIEKLLEPQIIYQVDENGKMSTVK